MREVLTTDTYKTIYKNITPSDEFRQRMLNQGAETKIYKMKPRLSYVAVIFICLLVMVGGTTYAYTHPLLVRKYFGEGVEQEKIEKLYSEINEEVCCDGYIYTVEGNIYDQKLGIGYLTIKIVAEDGSVPTVEGTYDVDKELFGETGIGFDLSRHWLKVDEQYVFFFFKTSLSAYMGTVEKEEDGAYFCVKYYTEHPDEFFDLAIVGKEEYQERVNSLGMDRKKDDSLIKEVDNSFAGIELTYQETENTSFCRGGIEALVGSMDIVVTWNKNETDLKNLALIEADGNRIEIKEGGHTIWDHDVLTGGTEEWNDKGEYTLEYQYGKIIDPQTVVLEVNGIIYPIQ